MEVGEDFVCEHGMPHPWAACVECMMLPPDERPQLRAEPPPVVAPRAKTESTSGARRPQRQARRSPAPPPARLPRTDTDALPDLVGDKDLAYEIPREDLPYYIHGPECDWLPISTLPRELRPLGHVYLQCAALLVARARVRGVGFRTRRWSHAAPDTATELGPGATLELDGDWRTVSISLGAAGEEPVPGYRYLIEQPDGEITVALPE